MVKKTTAVHNSHQKNIIIDLSGTYLANKYSIDWCPNWEDILNHVRHNWDQFPKGYHKVLFGLQRLTYWVFKYVGMYAYSL